MDIKNKNDMETKVELKNESDCITTVWNDLIGKKCSNGSYINNGGLIVSSEAPFDITVYDKGAFASEKHAKSALAMAQISQLMPYYGGEISDSEWQTPKICKYTITRYNNRAFLSDTIANYTFLSFHTVRQRDDFWRSNEQLINDYLMIK